jgi:GAF domain-containing protein
MNDQRDAGDFVRQVQESTQQYTRDLLTENDRLVGLVSSLLANIAHMEATSRAFTERYLEVEQLNANLANLYVASYRLHGSLEREQVLATLQEILVNIVGSEEFAIFERRKDGPSMHVVWSLGVDATQIPDVRLGEPGLGSCIARGSPHVPGHDPDVTEIARRITACIPLRIGDHVIGAIVVYRLLAHKPAVEEADLEMFNLLATHAATALYCSELHAGAQTGARA